MRGSSGGGGFGNGPGIIIGGGFVGVRAGHQIIFGAGGEGWGRRFSMTVSSYN